MNEMSFQNIRCLIRTPQNFDPEKSYPVLLFLHGAGTRGNDINKLYINPFFQLTDAYQDFPFVTVAPLCEKNTWFDIWERLKSLVQDVTELPFVDRDRIYVMGASMGGYATWQLAMSMPEYFAAIVPICGGGMAWRADVLRDLPIRIYHGEKDATVDVFHSKDIYNALKRYEAKSVELFLYAEVGHNVWEQAYEETDLIEWLISKRRL